MRWQPMRYVGGCGPGGRRLEAAAWGAEGEAAELLSYHVTAGRLLIVVKALAVRIIFCYFAAN